MKNKKTKVIKCLCGNLLIGDESFFNQYSKEKMNLTISQREEIKEWIQDFINFGNSKNALENRAYKIMKELIKEIEEKNEE